MFALTTKLLSGSGITPGSHPVLVSLIEMAAQKPGLARETPDIHALRKRLERQWAAVCGAFRAFVEFKASDADLLAALPFDGLSYSAETGWRITAEDLLSYRHLVACAITATVAKKTQGLKSFTFRFVGDLRRAQRLNRIPSLTAPIFESPGKVETPLIEGRGVVVSWPMFGLRLFAALLADEFGRMTALAFADSKKDALEAFNKRSHHASHN